MALLQELGSFLAQHACHLEKSIEAYFGYDARTYGGIQFSQKFGAHHGEVLTEGGIGDFYVESLVAYGFLGRISGHHFARDALPRGEQPPLEYRSFKSLAAQILLQEVA